MLPNWLLNEDAAGLPIRALRRGKAGIQKSINLGIRRGEETTSYIDGFLKLASEMGPRPRPDRDVSGRRDATEQIQG